jgi:hypothetical protein
LPDYKGAIQHRALFNPLYRLTNSLEHLILEMHLATNQFLIDCIDEAIADSLISNRSGVCKVAEGSGTKWPAILCDAVYCHASCH